MAYRIRMECSHCSFVDHATLEPEYYNIPDGTTAAADVKPCWCYTCQGVSRAERLPTEREVEDQLAYLLTRPPLPDDRTTAMLIRNCGGEEAFRDQRIALERQRLTWIRMRREAAKCLGCGSTHFDLFTSQDFNVPALQHPGCTGQLSMSIAAHVNRAPSEGLTVEGRPWRGSPE